MVYLHYVIKRFTTSLRHEKDFKKGLLCPYWIKEKDLLKENQRFKIKIAFAIYIIFEMIGCDVIFIKTNEA